MLIRCLRHRLLLNQPLLRRVVGVRPRILPAYRPTDLRSYYPPPPPPLLLLGIPPPPSFLSVSKERAERREGRIRERRDTVTIPFKGRHFQAQAEPVGLPFLGLLLLNEFLPHAAGNPDQLRAVNHRVELEYCATIIVVESNVDSAVARARGRQAGRVSHSSARARAGFLKGTGNWNAQRLGSVLVARRLAKEDIHPRTCASCCCSP